jgi:hypothetical protein
MPPDLTGAGQADGAAFLEAAPPRVKNAPPGRRQAFQLAPRFVVVQRAAGGVQ